MKYNDRILMKKAMCEKHMIIFYHNPKTKNPKCPFCVEEKNKKKIKSILERCTLEQLNNELTKEISEGTRKDIYVELEKRKGVQRLDL